MIKSALQGDVFEIALSRPEKRNALTPEMLTDLRAAIATAPKEAGAFLLSGEGAAFCAGFDLSRCKDSPDGAVMRALLNGLHLCIGALAALDSPVIIAAHGAAIAGGCALLGGGDVIVTNADAKLGYPVARLGVSPAVSAPFLRNLVGDGPTRARELENGLIDGRAAMACGLAHECTDRAEEVQERASAIAQVLAAKPRGAMAATKQWLRTIVPVRSGEDGLRASLSLVGGEEEQRLLPLAWSSTR
ncbi:MAG: enoyl-CoA hydratase/isomerase family protein [Phycisphaeraceae bacterium]|nr:enoyl-CoA hydratase/isomerase family protein [Phycisphaeraceae bacterium]